MRVCNVPKEHSTVTETMIMPNLFVPITTLNYHVSVIAPPTVGHLIQKLSHIQIHKLIQTVDASRRDNNPLYVFTHTLYIYYTGLACLSVRVRVMQ